MESTLQEMLFDAADRAERLITASDPPFIWLEQSKLWKTLGYPERAERAQIAGKESFAQREVTEEFDLGRLWFAESLHELGETEQAAAIFAQERPKLEQEEDPASKLNYRGQWASAWGKLGHAQEAIVLLRAGVEEAHSSGERFQSLFINQLGDLIDLGDGDWASERIDRIAAPEDRAGVRCRLATHLTDKTEAQRQLHLAESEVEQHSAKPARETLTGAWTMGELADWGGDLVAESTRAMVVESWRECGFPTEAERYGNALIARKIARVRVAFTLQRIAEGLGYLRGGDPFEFSLYLYLALEAYLKDRDLEGVLQVAKHARTLLRGSERDSIFLQIELAECLLRLPEAPDKAPLFRLLSRVRTRTELLAAIRELPARAEAREGNAEQRRMSLTHLIETVAKSGY